jgi:zinc transport system permease protein
MATVIGGLSAVGGLQMAYSFDTPTGPTIVCIAAVLFALSTVGGLIRGRVMG